MSIFPPSLQDVLGENLIQTRGPPVINKKILSQKHIESKDFFLKIALLYGNRKVTPYNCAGFPL